jgi:hypothetical protein
MTTSPSSPEKNRKAGPALFLVMLVIIIGSFLLFLFVRPKSPSPLPGGNTPTPSSQR